MFISSNHPLRCSKDKRPFAGPPTTWKAQIGEQVDHIGASQYTVWWNMLIAGSVEKVKRQWLQLKLGSELRHGTGKPMMVLYKDEGVGVVIAGVVVEECRSSSGKLGK